MILDRNDWGIKWRSLINEWILQQKLFKYPQTKISEVWNTAVFLTVEKIPRGFSDSSGTVYLSSAVYL